MRKLLLFLIVFIALVAIATTNVGLSSVKNSYGDMKHTNIEVLASGEMTDEFKCAFIGLNYCRQTWYWLVTELDYNSDPDYFMWHGYTWQKYCGYCEEIYLIITDWGCCNG